MTLQLRPLPAYLPSNTPVDELLDLLSDALPRTIFAALNETVTDALDNAAYYEDEHGTAKKEVEAAEKKLSRIDHGLDSLSTVWDRVIELIPKTRRGHADVEILGKTIEALMKEAQA